MPLHDPPQPIGNILEGQSLLVLGERVKNYLVKNRVHLEIFRVFEINWEKPIKA